MHAFLPIFEQFEAEILGKRGTLFSFSAFMKSSSSDEFSRKHKNGFQSEV
jgi:hypothetical protein